MQILGTALVLLTAVSSVLSFPEPDPVTGDTRGRSTPAQDTVLRVITDKPLVHDPSMCKDSSGTYFVFCKPLVLSFPNTCMFTTRPSTTASAVGTAIPGLEIRTSTDRKSWKFIGPVWDPVPEDTNQFTNRANGPLWAPDCTYIDGTFHVSINIPAMSWLTDVPLP